MELLAVEFLWGKVTTLTWFLTLLIPGVENVLKGRPWVSEVMETLKVIPSLTVTLQRLVGCGDTGVCEGLLVTVGIGH